MRSIYCPVLKCITIKLKKHFFRAFQTIRYLLLPNYDIIHRRVREIGINHERIVRGCRVISGII